MKGKPIFGLLVLWLVFLAFSCAPGPGVPSDKAASLSAPAPAVPKAAIQESWEKDWSKIVAAAKKEKSVLVYTSHGYTLRDALAKTFKEKFGINLEVMAGKSSQLTEKFLSERRANLHLADMMISGSTSILTSLKPAGALAPIPGNLILPEVTDLNNWRGGQMDWVDKDRSILAFEASVSGKIGINTNLVGPEEVKSLKDLLLPRWKGKMIVNDPSLAGTGSKFVGVVAEQLGWDIWRQIAAMEPVVLRDERLMVDWLTRGRYAIIIAPKTGPLFEAAKAGAPVKFIRLKEGNYRTGDVVALIKDAPHPHAAKVFLNWLLSREGQTIYHAAEGTWSARADVSVEGDPATRPEPGAVYFNGNSEEFLLRQPEHMEIARQIFQPYMR